MWFRSLVDGWKLRPSRHSGRRTPRPLKLPRPWLEALEDRTTPSFFPPVSYAVGSHPLAVATGDFNGDGRQDIAVVNFQSNTVSVLLANSDGSFQAAQNYATGQGPITVAVGDFNGDGKPDLVTGNYNDNTVSVLLNNGDGTFGAPANVFIGAYPRSVAVGDFNGDGKMDLAVTANNYYGGGVSYYGGSYPGFWEGRANVLLGNGTGGLAPPSNIQFLSGFHAGAAVGDFNGDGKLDVATVNESYGGVDLLSGDGTGALSFASSANSGFSNALAAADVNGDGKPDLVTANIGTNSISVLIGNGDNTFQPAQNYATGQGTVDVAVADFNSDGHPDVVTSNYIDSTVSVFLNTGGGTFGLAQNFASGGTGSLAAGDFNADGFPDLAVGNYGANTASVLINTGSWPTLQVSGFPSPDIAGQVHSITVTARDTSGNVLTGFTGTVHFSSSDPQADLPADYTFTGGDAGTHTFSVDLKTAGSQSIVVSDAADNISGGESNIAVNPAATSAFLVDGFPSPQSATIAGNFTVTAEDAYGNATPAYSGTVHFTSSDPQAVLPADATLSNGYTEFSATLNTVGNQSIAATDTANAAITGSQTGIQVVPLATISGPTAAAMNQTLTYTLGVNGEPAGTIFTYQIDWDGNGTIDQTVSGPSGTTVTHAYAVSGYDDIGVTATDPNNLAGSVTQFVYVAPVSVSIQTDPAKTSQQMLVITNTASYGVSIVLGNAANNGVSLTFNGTALADVLPTNGSPFALVVAVGGPSNDILDSRTLSISSVLVGGAGSDTLYGGSGRNLLIGDSGADTLNAGSGGDILIGASTSYDSNLTALASIMAEWGSSDSYTTRVSDINSGGGLNGSYRLTGTTISDDNTTDVLDGGSGMDWFFAHKHGKHHDNVVGQTTGEVVTRI